MYAIQNGSKFVKARFFLDPNEVFEFSVSDEPKTYKTRAEAERVMGLVLDKMTRSLAAYQKMIDDESAKVSKSKKSLERLEAVLEDLYTQPYKAVEKKVAQTRKQIANAEWYIKGNSVKSWSRDLARLERINQAGLSVVKMLHSVELA